MTTTSTPAPTTERQTCTCRRNMAPSGHLCPICKLRRP